jgi:hypothetical protein
MDMRNEANVIAEAVARQWIHEALCAGALDESNDIDTVREHLEIDAEREDIDLDHAEVWEDESGRFARERDGLAKVTVFVNGIHPCFAEFVVSKDATDEEIVGLIEKENDRIGGAGCPAVYDAGNDIHVYIEGHRAARLCQSAQ